MSKILDERDFAHVGDKTASIRADDVAAGLLALGLETSSVALVEPAGLVAGFGQGLSSRAALSGLQAETPADRRAEVASTRLPSSCVDPGVAVPAAPPAAVPATGTLSKASSESTRYCGAWTAIE